MKSTRFWIIRYLSVIVGLFALLAGLYLLRGMEAADAAREAIVWSLLAGTLFVGSRYYRARRGIACALCRDTVEE